MSSITLKNFESEKQSIFKFRNMRALRGFAAIKLLKLAKTLNDDNSTDNAKVIAEKLEISTKEENITKNKCIDLIYFKFPFIITLLEQIATSNKEQIIPTVLQYLNIESGANMDLINKKNKTVFSEFFKSEYKETILENDFYTNLILKDTEKEINSKLADINSKLDSIKNNPETIIEILGEVPDKDKDEDKDEVEEETAITPTEATGIKFNKLEDQKKILYYQAGFEDNDDDEDIDKSVAVDRIHEYNNTFYGLQASFLEGNEKSYITELQSKKDELIRILVKYNIYTQSQAKAVVELHSENIKKLLNGVLSKLSENEVTISTMSEIEAICSKINTNILAREDYKKLKMYIEIYKFFERLNAILEDGKEILKGEPMEKIKAIALEKLKIYDTEYTSGTEISDWIEENFKSFMEYMKPIVTKTLNPFYNYLKAALKTPSTDLNPVSKKIIAAEVSQLQSNVIQPLRDTIGEINETVFGQARVIVSYRQDGGEENYQDNYITNKDGCVYIPKETPCDTGGQIVFGGKQISYGPFSNIFNSNKIKNCDEGNVSEDEKCIYKKVMIDDGLRKKIINGESVVFFGYGFSGAGKTYNLVSNENENNLLKRTLHDEEIKKKCNKVTITVEELCPNYDDSDDVEKRGISDVFKYEFESDGIHIKKYEDTDYSFTKAAGEKIGHIFKDNEACATIIAGNMNQADTLLKALDSAIKEIDIYRKEHLRITATPNNPVSSRSHIFYEIKFKLNDGKESKFIIIDMAGSENTIEIRKDMLNLQNIVMPDPDKLLRFNTTQKVGTITVTSDNKKTNIEHKGDYNQFCADTRSFDKFMDYFKTNITLNNINNGFKIDGGIIYNTNPKPTNQNIKEFMQAIGLLGTTGTTGKSPKNLLSIFSDEENYSVTGMESGFSAFKGLNASRDTSTTNNNFINKRAVSYQEDFAKYNLYTSTGTINTVYYPGDYQIKSIRGGVKTPKQFCSFFYMGLYNILKFNKIINKIEDSDIETIINIVPILTTEKTINTLYINAMKTFFSKFDESISMHSEVSSPYTKPLYCDKEMINAGIPNGTIKYKFSDNSTINNIRKILKDIINVTEILGFSADTASSLSEYLKKDKTLNDYILFVVNNNIVIDTEYESKTIDKIKALFFASKNQKIGDKQYKVGNSEARDFDARLITEKIYNLPVFNCIKIASSPVHYKDPSHIIFCVFFLIIINNFIFRDNKTIQRDVNNNLKEIPPISFTSANNILNVCFILGIMTKYLTILCKQGKGIMTTIEHIKYLFLYNSLKQDGIYKYNNTRTSLLTLPTNDKDNNKNINDQRFYHDENAFKTYTEDKGKYEEYKNKTLKAIEKSTDKPSTNVNLSFKGTNLRNIDSKIEDFFNNTKDLINGLSRYKVESKGKAGDKRVLFEYVNKGLFEKTKLLAKLYTYFATPDSSGVAATTTPTTLNFDKFMTEYKGGIGECSATIRDKNPNPNDIYFNKANLVPIMAPGIKAVIFVMVATILSYKKANTDQEQLINNIKYCNAMKIVLEFAKSISSTPGECATLYLGGGGLKLLNSNKKRTKRRRRRIRKKSKLRQRGGKTRKVQRKQRRRKGTRKRIAKKLSNRVRKLKL